MKMHGGNHIAQWRKTLVETVACREIREVRVADIKIEPESRKTGFVDEGAEIAGIAHFTGGVFDADSDARMMRVQNQMLQRAKGSVALSRIRRFAGAAHVQDEARIRQVVGDVDDALQFVHGFDAADAFDLANATRSPAFAHCAQVAACRAM